MKFGIFYELSVPRPWTPIDPEKPAYLGTERLSPRFTSGNEGR